VVAIVAARDEAELIGMTVHALWRIDRVSEIIVVDDGSRDATSARAIEAGAAVFRRERALGKGDAIDRALQRANADVWLLADGDLGSSASALDAVLGSVLEGDADLAIAVFPPVREGGGFGLVMRTARWAIRRLCGFDATEPLSGQRAITATAIAAVRPLAHGFGMEAAMTIDAVRAGLRVVEVAAELSHRPYRNVRGFVHRGRQGWDVVRAVVPRAFRLR
jgi:glycosyltransferase involved in cell wall biosynthesis